MVDSSRPSAPLPSSGPRPDGAGPLGALPDDEGPVALGTDAAAGFALGLTLFVDGIRHRVRTLER